MDPTNDIRSGKTEGTVLMLPLTRREAILALYAAVATKKRKELPESGWTQITLNDGALD